MKKDFKTQEWFIRTLNASYGFTDYTIEHFRVSPKKCAPENSIQSFSSHCLIPTVIALFLFIAIKWNLRQLNYYDYIIGFIFWVIVSFLIGLKSIRPVWCITDLFHEWPSGLLWLIRGHVNSLRALLVGWEDNLSDYLVVMRCR